MRSSKLYATASVLALTLGLTGAALATPDPVQTQDITGNATNSNPGQISVTGTISGVTQIGVGASSSITAAGATASVGGLASGANFTSIGTASLTPSVGNINLQATNDGIVGVSSSGITFDDNVPFSSPAPRNLLNGASASISSLGASASVGFSGIGSGSYSVQSLAAGGGQSIGLEATNNSAVTTDGTTISSATSNVNNAPILFGAASSISTGATGASTSVGFRAVNATDFAATSGIGPITGTATNTGAVAASGNTITTGAVGDSESPRGNGSSVSLGSTGAVSSVSTAAIASGGFQANFDTVNQVADNSGVVSNSGSTVRTGQVRADGGSVSVSTVGAVTAVSEAFIANTANTASTFGAITQNAESRGAVSLSGSSTTIASNTNNNGLFGPGTSVAASATGAAASVSSATIRSSAVDLGSFSTVDQTVTNTAGVTVGGAGPGDGNSVTVNNGISGTAASASITAAGASGAVSSLVLNASETMAVNGGASFGAIDQNINNSGDVLNQGSILTVTPNAINPQNFSVSGAGASVGVAAIGASASVSGAVVSTLGTSTQGATFGTVTSDVQNSGTVSVVAPVVTTTAVSGAGASVSVSALGAQASASSTSVSARQDMADFSTVGQTVANDGTVSVTASPVTSVTTGALSGVAASAQMGATGASASVGSTLISSGTAAGNGADFGAITQGVSNSGFVTVSGAAGVPDMSVGEISGIAASANISAVGGSASVSSAYIAPSSSGGSAGRASGVTFGDVSSRVTNESSPVSVTNAQIATSGPISGTAASASISATGASASAGASVIGANNNVGTVADGSTTIGNITQIARNQRDVATVSVTGSQLDVAGISGTAASAGIGATGASASVQASYIGSTAAGPVIGATFGNIAQGTAGGGNAVANGRAVSVSDSSISAGALGGTAASASIGATGAQANVSVAAIDNQGSLTGTSFGDVGQRVQNNTALATVTVQSADINVASLGGTASSASISASGAAASVSVSEIGSTVAMGSSSFGTINQGTITPISNAAAVSVQNASIISTGGILGTGASASIGASGASANFAVTSVDNTAPMAPIQVAAINQTTSNTAAISNTGSSIAVGGALGTAASASISATGASTGVNFTAISAPLN